MLHEAYERLLRAYGPQGWWPAQSRLEVMVGAVLVQNTAWSNVERAIANLKQASVLSPRALYAVPLEELEALIRPSGVFRVKAQRLRGLLGVIVEKYDGSLDAMFDQPDESLRAELLSLSGIGPETADAILLYAAGRPSFVIDAYTRRVMQRHGWSEEGASYAELQQKFESALPRDTQLYNEYHALLVEVGKRHCKKSPVCAGCPLESML